MLRPRKWSFVLFRDVHKKFISAALCDQLNTGRQSAGIGSSRKGDCRMTTSVDPRREDGMSPWSNCLTVDCSRECVFGRPGLCGDCRCHDEVRLFKDLSQHCTELEQSLDRRAVIRGGHSSACICLCREIR